MLLIFDLDDTLIPTSLDITPKKLEQALKKMIESGLQVSFEQGREILLAMNEKACRSREVIREFSTLMQGTEAHAEIGLSVLEEDLSEIKVKQEEGLNEFLKGLKERYRLAIVTGGKVAVQEEKIDLYGIDRTLFEEIIVEEWGMKERAYMRLMDRFGPFLVVGDRITNDLSCAKKLGGITIHIRQGRGEFEPKNHPDVDFEIRTIKELTEVLERV